jgi:predicted pyridoxine 5'-phosphate oxidase superfamily flavin-nucleotide-binding protein
VDSLRNIVRDPRAALLFLIPGSGTTLRANGRAHLDPDPALLASFAVEGKAPRSVVVFRVESIYFQCARAVLRAGLWDPGKPGAAGEPAEPRPHPGRAQRRAGGRQRLRPGMAGPGRNSMW